MSHLLDGLAGPLHVLANQVHLILCVVDVLFYLLQSCGLSLSYSYI